MTATTPESKSTIQAIQFTDEKGVQACPELIKVAQDKI